MCHVRRFIRSAPIRHRGEKRTVGFHVESVEGNQERGGPKVVGVLEGHDTGNRNIGASPKTFNNFFGSSGETVDDGALRKTFGIEDVKEVVPRVTGVNDECEFEFVSELNLVGEDPFLLVAGTVFVEVVEATLANSDQSRIALSSECGDVIKTRMGVVGVKADSGVEVDIDGGFRTGEGERFSRRDGIGPHDNDRSNPAGVRLMTM